MRPNAHKAHKLSPARQESEAHHQQGKPNYQAPVPAEHRPCSEHRADSRKIAEEDDDDTADEEACSGSGNPSWRRRRLLLRLVGLVRTRTITPVAAMFAFRHEGSVQPTASGGSCHQRTGAQISTLAMNALTGQLLGSIMLVTAGILAADIWWSKSLADQTHQLWQRSQGQHDIAGDQPLGDTGPLSAERFAHWDGFHATVGGHSAEGEPHLARQRTAESPVVGAHAEMVAAGASAGASLGLAGDAADWQIAFERNGDRLLHAADLHVVDGVDLAALARGPGRYPGAVNPGELGNVAIAGHRTTYGAPFRDLDQLQLGDAIHISAGEAARWTYRVAGMSVVTPDEIWVVGPDPLGIGVPTLTLTTCHPKHRASHRLVIWATLDPAAAP